ncbi:hypothetical protein GCM10009579_71540 [Streptomyces javensis]|uniref:Uncharacterized protein n=1 Tax=Streptomyces javensis TaxID=114698 RepID=A0ABN1XB36_9ACTN
MINSRWGGPCDAGEEGAQLLGVLVPEVGEEAGLGGSEAAAHLLEPGASGAGEQDLACAAVARVGPAHARAAGGQRQRRTCRGRHEPGRPPPASPQPHHRHILTRLNSFAESAKRGQSERMCKDIDAVPTVAGRFGSGRGRGRDE